MHIIIYLGYVDAMTRVVDTEKEHMTEISVNQLAKIAGVLRAKSYLAQQQLASNAGVTFFTLNRWDNGKSKPSPLVIRQMEVLMGHIKRKE